MRILITTIWKVVQRSITAGLKFVAVTAFLICFTFISIAQAEDKFSETVAGTQFQHQLVIENSGGQLELFLTGMAVRKKYFFKIYSMAHYLEQKADISDEAIYKGILQNNATKQISMVFLRSLTAEQIQKSLILGMKLNTNEEEYQQILPHVEAFTHAIYADVQKNDEFIIRWYPDGTIVSIFEGEKISVIKNNRFARTLWSIWFGDDAVVDRKALIQELLSNS